MEEARAEPSAIPVAAQDERCAAGSIPYSVATASSPGAGSSSAPRAAATSRAASPRAPSAPQRCRSFGSGIPCSTRSCTSGKGLFCTSGRQRDTSSTRTDSASHTEAGVCRLTTRPHSGTGKPTRSSNDRSDAL